MGKEESLTLQMRFLTVSLCIPNIKCKVLLVIMQCRTLLLSDLYSSAGESFVVRFLVPKFSRDRHHSGSGMFSLFRNGVLIYSFLI